MRQYRFALKGSKSGELWSLGGRVIVHNSRAEMTWLFRKCIDSGAFSVVELPKSGEIGRPLLRLAHHPDMSDVRWPLRRSDFIEGGE